MKAACAQKQGAEDDDDGDDDHDMTTMTVILTVDHVRRTLQVVPLRGAVPYVFFCVEVNVELRAGAALLELRSWSVGLFFGVCVGFVCV